MGHPLASMLKSVSPTVASSPGRNSYGAVLTQYSLASKSVVFVGHDETHNRSASELEGL